MDINTYIVYVGCVLFAIASVLSMASIRSAFRDWRAVQDWPELDLMTRFIAVDFIVSYSLGLGLRLFSLLAAGNVALYRLDIIDPYATGRSWVYPLAVAGVLMVALNVWQTYARRRLRELDRARSGLSDD